jgi:hypothetical protein
MRRRRDRISVAIGGVALAASVLAVGSVFRWTQALVAVLIAGALLFQVSSRRKLDRLSPIVLLLVLAAAFTALQLIPLPRAVMDILNPTGAGLRADGADLAGTSPWSCISMDPAGTLRALAFFMTLIGVAVLSLRIGASERGRFVLLGGVAIACGLAALVTGLHMIVSATSLYGLYEPLHAEPPVLGPLLNPNHLGCLMALGATVSIGLTFHEQQSSATRALWIVIAVACTLITLASESRGAAISLALGFSITSGILIGRRLGDVAADGARRTFKQLPIALVMGIGLALAVYVSAGDVVDQLDRTSTVEIEHPASKFAAWRASVGLVTESPWVGIGRGAVEPTMTRVFDASAFHTYSHLENEYVSAIVEWGVPEALVLGLVLGWCIILAIRRWRDGALAAAALGGVAGVMFQSSVDFGIQLLGLAVPVTIVACTLLIVPLRETSRLKKLRVQRGLLVAAIAVMAAAVMLPAARSLQEDHDALLLADKPSEAMLLDIIQRHPLDYFAFGQIAELRMDKPGPRTVAFLNHALELHPSHAGLHRIAARLLVATNRKAQAAVEYEYALRGTWRPHPLLTEIVTLLPDIKEAAAAIPLDYPAPEKVLTSLHELKRDDVGERWLVRILEAQTHDLRMLDALYDLATALGDVDTALRAAQARLKEAHTQTSRVMLARAEFAHKDYDLILKDLADVRSWVGRIDERGDAWLIVCDTHAALEHWDEALQCIHQLDVSGLMTSRHDEIAQRETDIGNKRAAEAKLQQIQALERQMNLPVDTYLPVLPAQNTPAPTQPGVTITNPIVNPLRKSDSDPPSGR